MQAKVSAGITRNSLPPNIFTQIIPANEIPFCCVRIEGKRINWIMKVIVRDEASYIFVMSVLSEYCTSIL